MEERKTETAKRCKTRLFSLTERRQSFILAVGTAEISTRRGFPKDEGSLD